MLHAVQLKQVNFTVWTVSSMVACWVMGICRRCKILLNAAATPANVAIQGQAQVLQASAALTACCTHTLPTSGGGCWHAGFLPAATWHVQLALPVLDLCMQLTRAGLRCPCPAVLILYIGLRHGWWLRILRCCWSIINSTGGSSSSKQSDSLKAKQRQGKAKNRRGADSDEDGSGDEEVGCACCAYHPA